MKIKKNIFLGGGGGSGQGGGGRLGESGWMGTVK